MKFFNIDLHVSVIRDVREIFKELGHEIKTLSLSGHNWVFENEKIESPDIINIENWKNIDSNLCEKFYERYKEELDEYDGFIVTHTPYLAKIYEKFKKPVIIIASTRYEYPLTNDKKRWEEFNKYIETKNNFFLIANNKFDKKYCEMFINKSFKLIPSICSYTNSKYNPKKQKGLIYSKSRLNFPKTFFDQKIDIGKKSWEEIYSYKYIIHFPYNISTMSIFEQYYANVPLIFPTIKFSQKLLESGWNLYSEVSYRQVLNLSPKSLFNIKDDPNYYSLENILKCLKYADFYDFKNILYFDSFEDLEKIINNNNFIETSEKMKIENKQRYEKCKALWSEVILEIEGTL